MRPGGDSCLGGTTCSFTKEDRKRYPSLLQAATAQNPCHTNFPQRPVGVTEDPFEALEHQGDVQRNYSGDIVLHPLLHLYMRERLSRAEACLDVVRRVLPRFRLDDDALHGRVASALAAGTFHAE